jgi:cytoskeletal protein CcmA (bactofilin family)
MFSKASKDAKAGSKEIAPPAPVVPPQQEKPRVKQSNTMPSIVSAGLQVTGNMISDGDVQIEGAIEGDVKSRMLTVGEAGSVKGGIEAEQVFVSGEVIGKIKAANVSLARTARVSGDIIHEVLSVEAGAHLEGNMKRLHGSIQERGARKPDATFVSVKSEIKNVAQGGRPGLGGPAVKVAMPE